MSVVMRTVAVSSLALALAAGCTTASPGQAEDGDGNDGDNPATDLKGFSDLDYLSHDGGNSSLLRWDGTADSEVETVLEGDELMYETLEMSVHGEYASWAEDRGGAATLVVHDLEQDDTIGNADRPAGDDCVYPSWSNKSYRTLLVPAAGDGQVTMYTPEGDYESDPMAIDGCDLRPAGGEGDADAVYYWNTSKSNLEYVMPGGELVQTEVGQQVPETVGGLSAVSFDGGESCVRLESTDDRRYCDLVFDTATGDLVAEAGDEPFQMHYLFNSGALERTGGQLRHIPSLEDRDGEVVTATEPAELSDAALVKAVAEG